MILSCQNMQNTNGDIPTRVDKEEATTQINELLNNWHNAAANADFEAYFDFMARDGIFIGTDARENWSIENFKKFSKPYFDRGTAWNFKSLDRNIYPSESGPVAWFDELLETWMGICIGSGVMIKEDGKWKIQHYVLSVTIPNDNIDEVVRINKEIDSSLVLKLRKAQ